MTYKNQIFKPKPCLHCGDNFQPTSTGAKYCGPGCGLESRSVIVSSGCREWQGFCNAKGYGMTVRWRGTQLVHKIAWMLAHGEVPTGLMIRHDCDNAKCVNVGHLRLGTNADNMADGVGRMRFPRGESRPTAKLTEADVRVIREDWSTRKRGQREMAEAFNVHRATIRAAISGKKWGWLE